MAATESHYDKIYVKEGKIEQQFNVPPGCTLGDLRAHIAEGLELRPEYIKLIHRGKVLTQDESALNKVGIRYGSKMTMMRSDEYHQDKATIDIIHKFSKEIAVLEQQSIDPNLTDRDAVILDEVLTGLLERIDGIDTSGRPSLRAMRKSLVLRAQTASDKANEARKVINSASNQATTKGNTSLSPKRTSHSPRKI
mmetsp:Transcript_3572/g.4486  ORF Transcript_3572/g.4486 Transcript_3572/m.4486 type:complete len:195 (-) Transcript_3572:269-853(-)